MLESGDIILYKEVPVGEEAILWGEMYLLSFVIDGESYISIKYVQKADEEHYVRLVSQNPHHSPKEIPADAIKALALVKASIPLQYHGIIDILTQRILPGKRVLGTTDLYS